ncbi:MAG: hypothetical protein AB1894_06410 [Chloroflexota bacterium]
MNKKSFPLPITLGILVIILATLAYIYVYQAAPFPEPWTDVYLNLGLILPAVLAATLSLLVWRSFDPQDTPRGVWLNFSLGWWCWALADLIWFILFMKDGEVASTSLADVFWLLAYVPFAAAFTLQYRLIFQTDAQKERRRLILAVLAVLAGMLVSTLVFFQLNPQTEETFAETLLELFYVFGDLALMIAALRLSQLFGRGLWGRAWLGMLAFVISDGLYAWLEFSGMYAASIESGNLLTLLVDSLYGLAYWIVALACLVQLLLMRYGPALAPSKELQDSA